MKQISKLGQSGQVSLTSFSYTLITIRKRINLTSVIKNVVGRARLKEIRVIISRCKPGDISGIIWDIGMV